MVKVLPPGLIYKMAKFRDASNPGSLASTKGSIAQARTGWVAVRVTQQLVATFTVSDKRL